VDRQGCKDTLNGESNNIFNLFNTRRKHIPKRKSPNPMKHLTCVYKQKVV